MSLHHRLQVSVALFIPIWLWLKRLLPHAGLLGRLVLSLLFSSPILWSTRISPITPVSENLFFITAASKDFSIGL
jgi:hypothetical protein